LKSARANILGWILIPVFFAMIATFVLSAVLLLNDLSEKVDQRLNQEAQELYLLADRAIDPVSGQSYTTATDILQLYIRRSVPDDLESIFVIVNGEVVERSSGADVPRIDRDTEFIQFINSTQEPELATYQSGENLVRYISIPVVGSGDSGHLVAAIFLEQERQKVEALLTQLALLMLVALLSAVGAGWLVAGRLLMPLRQLREITRRVKDGTTDERITGFNPSQEIGGIASDFNSMLDRTASAFASQRRFVDDAGHELKTPLTIIRGHLDLLKLDPTEASASLTIVEDEVLRMTRIVQDLQTLTKSNQASFVQAHQVVPSEIVDEVFVKTAPLAERKWSMEAQDLSTMPLDRQRMVQALVQLVDNAIKHTSIGDAIVIGCRAIGDSLELYVGDSGPGIPEDSRVLVQERFARGAWTSQDIEGSGLGLAIVAAIAKGHDGEVFIRDSVLGGAEVGIMLNPKARAEESLSV
jgi:two-component system, OmpR family, sensor kinase